MASRMDRYYTEDTEYNRRSSKNSNLYNKIYDEDAKYSNIEGIASIEKTNEIDITKIREMLKNREDYQKEKEFRQIVKPSREREIEYKYEDDDNEEEKSYDIRNILEKARVDNKDIKNEYRSLNNTQYNILKSIDIDKEYEDYLRGNDKKEDLEELIHTITNTSMLKKLEEQELALSMLDDFKTKSHNLKDTKSIQAIMDEEYEKEKTNEFTDTIDKSFYTGSMKLSKQDFGDDAEIKENDSLGKALKILIGLAVIILIILLVYIVLKK